MISHPFDEQGATGFCRCGAPNKAHGRITAPEDYAREVLHVAPPSAERLRALRGLADREHVETMLAHLGKGVAEGDSE